MQLLPIKALRQLGLNLLCSALLAALASCATGVPDASQKNSLVGKFWDADARRFVNPEVLIERALWSDIVLLGETHDNPEHHHIQEWLLDAVSSAGPVAALVMEQYDLDQQREIDAIVEAPLAQDEKLERFGKIMGPGWSWPGYRPLIALTLHQQTPVVAANISRDVLRKVARSGFSALGGGEAQRLALHKDWSDAQQQQLEKEIFDSHCGKLPPVAVAAISKAQRARDAIMADKLAAIGSKPAIAILGRGHVRKDLAAPLYLAARVPGKKVLSVGIVEAGTIREPTDYAFGALGKLYDFVVFTKAVAREADPCDSIIAPAAKDR